MSATITVIDRATVAKIREAHEACERAGHEWLEHAIECGRLLAEVKGQLRHGEWGPWLDEHFPASERTARVYMQVAGAPEAKRQASAETPSIASVLREISTSREPRPEPRPSVDALRQLGGGQRSPDLDRRLAEARAQRERIETWSDAEARKLARAVEQLETVLSRLDDARNTSSLSRQAVGQILRDCGVEAKRAASVLDDLAFSFER